MSKLVDNLSTGVEDIQLKMEQLNDEMAKEIARVQKGNGGRSSRRESFNPVQPRGSTQPPPSRALVRAPGRLLGLAAERD